MITLIWLVAIVVGSFYVGERIRVSVASPWGRILLDGCYVGGLGLIYICARAAWPDAWWMLQ